MKTEVTDTYGGQREQGGANDYVIPLRIGALMMSALRRMAGILALTALVTASVGVLASPASAKSGWNDSYTRDEYCFKHKRYFEGSKTTHTIHVFKDCKKYTELYVGPLLIAYATYDPSHRVIELKVLDKKCDNKGLDLRTWGRAGQIVVSTPGCVDDNKDKKGTEKISVRPSDLVGPRNFWVYVGGKTNSNAVPLPLP